MKYLSLIVKPPILNQLAFYSLMGSGAYAILLWSPNVLGEFFSRSTKSIIYIFPWLMLWLAYSWQVVANREHRLEILFIVSIIILGLVNVLLSDSPSNSLSPMRTLLLTGIFALWTSMFLLTDQRRRKGFDCFCAGALAVIILGEMIVYGVWGNYGPGVFQVLTLHLIPFGTLIILLSTGPVRLIRSENSTAKLLGWLLILLGGSLIFLLHKRGTWLALAAMLAVGMIYLVRRQRYLLISLLLVVGLILPLQAKSRFARLDPTIGHYITILHRLELYNFALHVWKTHPIMGIGLRSFTHEQYLTDYQPLNPALHDFPRAVATIQTFDNMGLTALVELGSLMTLLYFGLVIGIVVRYCRKLWLSPEPSTLGWYRVLVLLGWGIHSLSYDSLLFPSINWLFHVQLGIMAGYHASETAPG
jgi:hypothetical protein